MEQNANVAADTTSVASVVKGIVDIVLAKLNITERGKIENFFMKQRNELSKEIRDLNKNRKTLTDDYADALEDFNEQLVDAKVEVDEAYSSVTVENVSSNGSAKSFADKYWDNIEICEQKVEGIKEATQVATDNFNINLAEIDAQIVERERRLFRIS